MSELHTIVNIFPPCLQLHHHLYQLLTHQDQLERVQCTIIQDLPMDTVAIPPTHCHFEYILRLLPVVVHPLPQVTLLVNRNELSMLFYIEIIF